MDIRKMVDVKRFFNVDLKRKGHISVTVVLLIAMVMAVGLLAGCGKQVDSGASQEQVDNSGRQEQTDNSNSGSVSSTQNEMGDDSGENSLGNAENITGIADNSGDNEVGNNNGSNAGVSDSGAGGNSSGSSSSGNGSGGLRVSGTNLTDASGNIVQLRGVSTHGLAWFPQYVNKEAFVTLRDDWGANVVRLAMYTEEYGGYCNGGDREALEQLIDDGVNYAAELGMYVIIDWHILSDGNPNQNKEEAKAFFTKMSSKYAGYGNVIYEICNEPQNSDWNSQIKPYASEVIACIRANAPDALILVGTNNWSQDIDAVIGNKLDDENVMYVLHFYAGTHKEWLQDKMLKALNAGVPVFVSECSICDASGNGGIDYDSADKWVDVLNSNNISFLAWSFCNKNETSALIRPDCAKLSGWTEDDLSETGRWFRNAIRN